MAKKKTYTTFKINGTTYTKRDFDFNTVCEFDLMGINFSEIGKHDFASARAYLALYNNNDTDWAGRELQAHIVNGGTLIDMYKVMGSALSESDFFRALSQKNDTTENQSETEVEDDEE